MTYIPRPGERVRVLEVNPDDGDPNHEIGDVTIAGSATEVALCDDDWCYLDGERGGPWCRVEPVRDVRPGESFAHGEHVAADPDRWHEGARHAVVSVVRVRAYPVIAQAVEDACMAGVHRAYKHTDEPSRDAIAEACADAVKAALCEVLDFGDES